MNSTIYQPYPVPSCCVCLEESGPGIVLVGHLRAKPLSRDDLQCPICIKCQKTWQKKCEENFRLFNTCPICKAITAKVPKDILEQNFTRGLTQPQVLTNKQIDAFLSTRVKQLPFEINLYAKKSLTTIKTTILSSFRSNEVSEIPNRISRLAKTSFTTCRERKNVFLGGILIGLGLYLLLKKGNAK